jgi:hypothetical protein
MCELVRSDTSTRAAGAFRIVEHEINGPDVAVDQTMRCARDPAESTLDGGFRGALDDVQLHQAIADQQRGENAGLDLFFLRSLYDETVHDCIHFVDIRLVHLQLIGKVHSFAIHDQSAATLFPQFRKDVLEFFAVDLEDGRAQLDLGAFRK